MFKTTARKGEDEEVEEEAAEALDEEDVYRQQVFSFRVSKVIYLAKMEIEVMKSLKKKKNQNIKNTKCGCSLIFFF